MGQIIKIPAPIDVDNLATIDEVNQIVLDGNFASKLVENTFTKKQIILLINIISQIFIFLLFNTLFMGQRKYGY